MSASLVGSEMCIRDRLSRGTSWLRAPTPACFSRDYRCTLSLRRSAVTVSYTHLTLPTICSV
eukprot:13302045-Alexandrium_andersonii.AAC.1